MRGCVQTSVKDKHCAVALDEVFNFPHFAEYRCATLQLFTTAVLQMVGVHLLSQLPISAFILVSRSICKSLCVNGLNTLVIGARFSPCVAG